MYLNGCAGISQSQNELMIALRLHLLSVKLFFLYHSPRNTQIGMYSKFTLQVGQTAKIIFKYLRCLIQSTVYIFFYHDSYEKESKSMGYHGVWRVPNTMEREFITGMDAEQSIFFHH